MTWEVYESMGGTLPDPTPQQEIHKPGDGNHAPVTQAEKDAIALSSLNATAEECARAMRAKVNERDELRRRLRDLEGMAWALKCAVDYALDVDGYHLGADVKQALEDAVYRLETYTEIYGEKAEEE